MSPSRLTVALAGRAFAPAPAPASASALATALALALALALAALGAAPALARDYAPLDRPGPPLDVPAATLQGALACTDGVAQGGREPVLLVPGTELTPAPNFSWNYEPALAARGIPYCTIELPVDATGDIQVAGEYVVYAIRRMHELSGRRVQIIGFSQGGMVPRWALRFWPDTRAMVDDDIGLDASNHGTLDSEFCPAVANCPAAFWQQRASSPFIAALNSGAETFAGISYTEIYSHLDEVVVPNADGNSSSSVHGGSGAITNVAVQRICPADISDHLAMGSYDAVGFALALDAVDHAGPADPARIPASVCATPFGPGVDPLTFPADYAAYLAAIGQGAKNSAYIAQEPSLRCYVFADCPAPATPGRSGAPSSAPRRRPAAHRVRRHRTRHRSHRRRRSRRHAATHRRARARV